MPNVLLRVYLMDNTHKTVYVDPETTTIEELWAITSQKLLLNGTSPECFFIWAVSKDIELLLYSDMVIQDVYDDWPSLEEKYGFKQTVSKTLGRTFSTLGKKPTSDFSPSKISLDRPLSATTFKAAPGSATVGAQSKAKIGLQKPKSANGKLDGTVSSGVGVSVGLTDAETDSFKLVFRPTAVLPLAIENGLMQPEAVHLFYIQAVHHVIQSNYPCTSEAAIQLGGIQLQIALGDQKPEHNEHFTEALDRYIPEHLRNQRKPDEWVTDLVAAHLLHRGKDPNMLKRQYIDTLQQFPFYGSTFFKAKYIPAVTSFYKQDYQGVVSLGLNRTGIHIIDPKVMKYTSCGFRDLVFWDSMHTTFVFEMVTGNKQAPTRRYTFKTQQAELINDLMHDWSEEWRKQVVSSKDANHGAGTLVSPPPAREREQEKILRKQKKNSNKE